MFLYVANKINGNENNWNSLYSRSSLSPQVGIMYVIIVWMFMTEADSEPFTKTCCGKQSTGWLSYIIIAENLYFTSY